MTKKDLMMKQTPHPRPEFPIERKVWHKPYHSSVERIEEHGFHRSNASSKTGNFDHWCHSFEIVL